MSRAGGMRLGGRKSRGEWPRLGRDCGGWMDAVSRHFGGHRGTSLYHKGSRYQEIWMQRESLLIKSSAEPCQLCDEAFDSISIKSRLILPGNESVPQATLILGCPSLLTWLQRPIGTAINSSKSPRPRDQSPESRGHRPE